MNRELLIVNGLTKKFDDTTVLDGISFSIRKGEVVVLVGSSGCGKSTLLRCLNGIEDIQGGSILLDGEAVRFGSKELTAMRQKIGMVFQSYELFPHLNVLGNITLAPMKVQKREKGEVESEAKALLERVGLSDKADSLPRELSGGQKQRVAIVRALIMHPEVILFDEVTAALDPEMVREVLDVIMDLAKQGRTMLIVTHEMAFARAIADRVLFLDEGHIVEDKDPETFFDNPSTQRARKFLGTFTFDRARGAGTIEPADKEE
ncbi:MAG: amino acid ABC transporter ATP-binding protein [Lachnospiraceae bacterium]|nr:amino acid ABC transporter ATP-binding protein [Lachnospiraceae bacterium]